MAGGGMLAGLEEYLDGALEELSALRSHDDDAVALVEIAAVLDRFGERLQALRVDVIRRADLVADEHTDVKMLLHASNFMTQAEAEGSGEPGQGTGEAAAAPATRGAPGRQARRPRGFSGA